MVTFDIADLFPRFLLNDKNGHAMAKAMEAGLKYFLEKCQDGLDTLTDIDKMPEWRLDELAWEYGILYDYRADIETKRAWIKDATPYYLLYGTVAGIKQYLEGRFDSIDVQECWQYGGDPFHFRVIVTGEWSDEADEWAKKAVAATKNVRSVLDTITFNAGTVDVQLYTAAAVCGIDIADEVQML